MNDVEDLIEAAETADAATLAAASNLTTVTTTANVAISGAQATVSQTTLASATAHQAVAADLKAFGPAVRVTVTPPALYQVDTTGNDYTVTPIRLTSTPDPNSPSPGPAVSLSGGSSVR